MAKLSSKLYNASRTLGRAASKANDVETALSGNPFKVLKRNIRKSIGKHFAKAGRNIEKRFR